MIEIKRIYIKNTEMLSRLCVEISKDGTDSLIWYETNIDYGKYWCDTRIDGVVVNLLLYCMQYGHNIKSNVAISEKLLYNLTKILIPTIAKNISEYNSIEITAPIDSFKIENEGAVGTGLSCGVDSFYTILKNVECSQKTFNVTHLTFFNAGASGNFGGESARQLFNDRLSRIKPAADELKLKLITVDTNINEFICQTHESSHTFRNLAIPLLMQKLFSVYYYSSGYGFENFRFDYQDTASYDLLTCTSISNENITFYSYGGDVNRINKVKFISDFDVVQKYLNVCIDDEKNCGRCGKCIRTQMELYSINKIEYFSKAFDLDYFYHKKNDYISRIFLQKKFDVFYKEIYDQMKCNNIKIPISVYTYLLLKNIIIIVLKKIYHIAKKIYK